VRVSPQTLALIRLAVNPASAEGEARNAALSACKQLVQGGILGDSFVMPESEPAAEEPVRQGSYDPQAGGVQADNVGDFFGGMAAAAASARRHAEAEDAKRAGAGSLECDHGITFDAREARGMIASEVQRRWPRGFFLALAPCPTCGYVGIYYASEEHKIAGDW
jgi:hypothetical protein